MIQIGEKFPDFKLKNQNGELISNEDLKGSKVVVYFTLEIIHRHVRQKHVILEIT